MNSKPNNPSTNTLPGGMKESDLEAAITKSGYPLQTLISCELNKKNFGVVEEWSYIDKDENKLRAIDLLAQIALYDFKKSEHLRLRPTLSLLIECKHSLAPYVFFLSHDKSWLPNFPSIAGLFNNEEIALKTNDDLSTYCFSVVDLLSLDNHKFVKDVDTCASLSKCERRGSNFELSGSDAFLSLVLPITKSVEYFRSSRTPHKIARYFDCYLTLGVAVLDAPMIAVNSNDHGPNKMTHTPWVRVLKHESLKEKHAVNYSKLFVVDVVHKDFFNAYIGNHVLPFAAEFSKLAVKHTKTLISGKGFARGLGKRGGSVEPRLRIK